MFGFGDSPAIYSKVLVNAKNGAVAAAPVHHCCDPIPMEVIFQLTMGDDFFVGFNGNSRDKTRQFSGS